MEKNVDTYKIVFYGLKDINLEHVFECGQCFRWVPADDDSGDYIGATGKYAARVHLEQGAAGMTLVLEVTGGDEKFWHDYFNLDNDYSAIKKELVAKDKDIEPATDYGYGIRILNQNLFETIISFIISQNNNIPRIRKNIESICEKYGEVIGNAFGRTWHAFPTPESLAAADVDDLMQLKLGYRSSYLKAAGERFIQDRENGNIPSTREEILSYLGIGPKVANCIMLFGLRCTEAFPVDTWVKHIMNDMYGFEENDSKGMIRFAEERFGKNAGYAQQYLFYYYRDKKL